MQNIMHYSFDKHLSRESKDEHIELRRGVIMVSEVNDHFLVYGCNLVEDSEIAQLDAQLSRIQKMNNDELKRFYKEQRRKELDRNTASKGAGLGFIEMAKNAISILLSC